VKGRRRALSTIVQQPLLVNSAVGTTKSVHGLIPLSKGEKHMRGSGSHLLRRAVRVALAGGVVAAVGIGVPTVATADPGGVPAGFASWADVMKEQYKLNAAGERVDAAPGAKEGLAGIVARPESRRLVVYWKGTMPAATTRLIQDLRAQVPIDVRPARFSATELVAASKVVAARPGVTSAGGNVDGSGIAATVDTSARFAQAAPASAAVGAIPVSVTPGGGPAEPADCSGRQDDCSPYFAGGLYLDTVFIGPTVVVKGSCTTGFAIRIQTAVNILSAGHCAENFDPILDGGGTIIGSAMNKSAGHDTVLIIPDAPNTATGQTFIQAWNGSATRRVAGASRSFVGGVVCTSGSATGENCEVRITAVNLTVKTTGGTFSPLVKASVPAGRVAMGKGDSGGPVYFGNADGTVNAAGTISSGQDFFACPAGLLATQCSSTVYYADITDTLAFYNAQIVT
jgi:hypothetical protein